MFIRRLSLIGAALALSACGGGKSDDSTNTSVTSVGETSTTTMTSADDTGMTSLDGDSGSGGANDSGGEDGSSGGQATSGGVGFIMEPDGGGAMMECDPYAQDCAAGEKCMPWANDGGSAWNATKCSPLDPNPGQPGDPCTVEGSGVSGIDTCDVATMCWDVDPETNMGTCVAFCTGTAADPMCEDPMTICSISNDGVLNLCLPSCDPLLQACPEGQACYPILEEFACFPDAGGDLGAYGDPCEYLNVCDPGLYCSVPEAVPGCAGSLGCCTEFCDLTDPAGNDQCMGAAMGQECTPWFMEGQAPPGFENVGGCAIPA
jgi:hypothetical protein